MTWLALGALALLLLLAALRAFANAPVASVKKGLAWMAGGLGAVLLVALVLSGRAGQAIWTLVLRAGSRPRRWRWCCTTTAGA